MFCPIFVENNLSPFWKSTLFICSKIECTDWVFNAKNGWTEVSKKERAFLEEMIAHLELYFPIENEITKQLSKLFTIGITRANIMILPKRILQKRGKAPYYDYMPHFLADILEHQKIWVTEQEGVKEILAFENMKEAIDWMEKENLTVFFAGKEIALENIIDIHCTDDVKCNLPREGGIDKLDFLKMLRKYNQILSERQKYFSY